jgi:molybdopterin-guanine dinucleotide biosynthesis protein A
MKFPCTGVILSGGLNTRFSGREKAFMRVGEKRIIDHIYDLFVEIFEEVILVTNHPLRFLEWDLKIVTDLFDIRSSLTGIHAGLFHAANPYVFVTACDAPFLKNELVQMLLDRIDGKVDIIMPQTSAGREPLCAIYSKRCLEVAENHLRHKKLKIQLAFRKCRMKHVSEKALREKDPDLLSFFNINTPEDLATAEEIYKGL